MERLATEAELQSRAPSCNLIFVQRADHDYLIQQRAPETQLRLMSVKRGAASQHLEF